MNAADRDRGELCILLHSHMPYVEGFGTWPFGEEWLLEAIAACYLPLLELLESWAGEGRDHVLTVGITPVLADQLALAEVGERFLRFMYETRAECHRRDIDGLERGGEFEAAAALRQSARDYQHAAEEFERRGRDLIDSFRQLADTGVIELWTSSATHAVLPLIATEGVLKLQLATGIDVHRERFGGWSGGFWLPECAYSPGLEEQLAGAGVRAFCVDRTNAADDLAQLEPVATAAGPVAVPIDWRTISLVWSDQGYPSDPVYRDYHAPSINGLRPWANGGGAYDAGAAGERAREHARDFVAGVVRRLEEFRAARARPGTVLCALDAELLGHWWYEGPLWLAEVVAQAGEMGLALSTLPAALARHDPRECSLVESSWGAGKDLRTWDSPDVASLVWPARNCELRLVAALGGERGQIEHTAAERAARELLALQSSDWAFMATRELAADYPEQRARSHARDFERALATLTPGMKDLPVMSTEEAGALGPDLRGLAPRIDLSCLLAAASPWGRPVPVGGLR